MVFLYFILESVYHDLNSWNQDVDRRSLIFETKLSVKIMATRVSGNREDLLKLVLGVAGRLN